MRKLRSRLAAGAAITGVAVGGAALANAATSSSASSTSTTPAATQTTPPSSFPAPGTAAHEDAEKTVTGAAADKARAAAVKSVGSGTAGAATTDFTSRGYEVTVTKSGGTKVEVHLDSSFKVMQPPAGHGPPGHGPAGMGPGSPGPGRSGGSPSAGQAPGGQGGAPPAGYGA